MDRCRRAPSTGPACATARSSPTTAWARGWTAPARRRAKVAASAELAAQLKLQDEAAGTLREARHRLGALTFDRLEAQPVFADGKLQDITARAANRAAHLIEDFMIAANEVMARTLRDAGVSSIRRVVKAPERWPRIVELATPVRRHAARRARSGGAQRVSGAAQSGRPGALCRRLAFGAETDGSG